MTINGSTRLFAIVGNPVHHSLSPVMHNTAFQALNYNGVYVPLHILDIQAGLQGMRHLGFKGASITVPHKETVLPLVDEVDEIAKEIGAANTLVFTPSDIPGIGKVKAYNTDWLGSNHALEQHISLQGSSALVLGAGGAAKAVAYGLLRAGAKVTLCNRTQSKAEELAQALQCQWIPQEALAACTGDILINTTTVGMTPNVDRSPFPATQLRYFQVVMDIVYAPLETQLLKDAREQGCKTIDGLAMLLFQGVEQFSLWTGQKPPVQLMRQALIDALPA
ncbi:shikimate dehydrogenase [Desulfogranum japonicum]|uniref:shikimate dehydrogenase n=1 Tax=Desulfogranum japonicum TaxID=231447 RepID=UPI0004040E48|nr:shikimate dehydrogenase [Desulfogranum japonicum]